MLRVVIVGINRFNLVHPLISLVILRAALSVAIIVVLVASLATRVLLTRVLLPVIASILLLTLTASLTITAAFITIAPGEVLVGVTLLFVDDFVTTATAAGIRATALTTTTRDLWLCASQVNTPTIHICFLDVLDEVLSD